MVYIRNIGNNGEHVPLIEDGTKIIFGIENNNFTVDVAELQSDIQITFDVMQDNDGKLGANGNWYVATINIPPKHYEMVEDPEQIMVTETGERLLAFKSVALPLDMGAVEVVLYPLSKSLELQSDIIEEAE